MVLLGRWLKLLLFQKKIGKNMPYTLRYYSGEESKIMSPPGYIVD